MTEEKNEETASAEPQVAPIIAAVQEKFGLIHHHSEQGDDTIVIAVDDLTPVMEFLKNEPSLNFDLPTDLTVVDYLNDIDLQPYLRERKARFEVVYHLYSVEHNHRIRVKVPVQEDDPHVNSITHLWPGFDWEEREAWDLYGIVFRGHHNLKRILLYEEFEGHPLRKDYDKFKRQPLIGPRN